MSEASLTSQRPYLLRAIHEWITDNKHTPYIAVDAEVAGVEVPRQYVQNGKIILNISLEATDGLTLGNDAVSFRAVFSGVRQQVFVPVAAVLCVYARETGQGIFFPESDTTPPPPPTKHPTGDETKRPKLKLVK